LLKQIRIHQKNRGAAPLKDESIFHCKWVVFWMSLQKISSHEPEVACSSEWMKKAQL
jgi:hypothetical protein